VCWSLSHRNPFLGSVGAESNAVTSRAEPVHEADPSIRIWLMCDVDFSEVHGISKDCKFWSSSRT